MRAIEDPALVAEIAERGIVLEVCPTSATSRLGVFPSYESHPLRGAARSRCAAHVGLRRPALLRLLAIGGEYAVARERFGFEEGELRTITRTAVEASFADDAVKSALLNRITASGDRRSRIGSRRSRSFDKRSSGRAPTSSFHRSAARAGVLLGRSRPAAATTTTPASGSSGTSTATSTPAAKKIKVGLVTDIGGLNDRSFNQLANEGLEQAKSELGVDGRVLISKSNADYVPNLSHAGPAEVRPRDRRRLPDGRRDGHGRQEVPEHEVRDHRRRRRRRSRASRRTSRACCSRSRRPATSSATWPGLYAKDNGGGTVGSRRRPEDPAGRPLHRRLPGRRQGRPTRASRRSTATRRTSSTRRKCKEIALNQIAKGSKVVFQVAGQCGLGALDAAKEKGVQGIGVDADQAYLGDADHDLGAQEGRRRGLRRDQGRPGRHVQGRRRTSIFDVKSGGVGIGKTNADGAKYADQVKEIQDKIASGEITDIPDTVK